MLRLYWLTVLCGSRQAGLKRRAKTTERVSVESMAGINQSSPLTLTASRRQRLSSGHKMGLFSDQCVYAPFFSSLSLLPSTVLICCASAVTSLSCSPVPPHISYSLHPTQIPSIHLKARAAAEKQILANSSASSSPSAEGKKEHEKLEG